MRPRRSVQALQHGYDGDPDSPQQVRTSRHAIIAGVVFSGASDNCIEPIVDDLARDPFRLEIGHRNVGLIGIVPSRLEQGKIIFDLVIGDERFRDQIGRQQLVIAELRNDLLFKCHRS
jgi:hypothetical protein